MKATAILLSSAVALLTFFASTALAIPHVFAGRALPGVMLGTISVAGLPEDELAAVIEAYDKQIGDQVVQLQLRGASVKASLKEIGISVDEQATAEAITQTSLRDIIYGSHKVTPRLAVDQARLQMGITRQFPELITAPQNATLTLSGAQLLTPVPSRRGEEVDRTLLQQQLATRLTDQQWDKPIALGLVEEPAAVQDNEIETARQFAEVLLTDGLNFIYTEETFHMLPSTVRRLLVFGEQPDPHNADNRILGVQLDPAGLEDYFQKTLAPQINQEAQDARFVLEVEGESPRVTQFSLPQQGQTLNIMRTVNHVNTSLAQGKNSVPLAVDVVAPEIATSTDIEQLGLTALLATGESDFAGSPKNRVHNITVGASRYHGLLIAPGQEFSFNEFLGPVDAANGFLPELVIKKNVTTPEYGGGLCQVSTTVFRAALNAGLEITDRRNHAYAVSYYGTPGLDATIYPPYTDLQFTNNTPNYILVQTKIDGSKLLFDFWGTNDGREVAVTSPTLYDQQPDGAVKAFIGQQVTRNGEVIVDDTFYSRYKSPKLFPKVLAANGENTN